MSSRKMIILYGSDGILNLTKKSASTIWRWERDGLFPKRHKIGPNSVAWFSDEFEVWLNNPAGYKQSVEVASL